MLEQGCMSSVEVIDGRIFKTINKVNVEGTVIPLYEEYKILKYVQNLGPEFPQNVRCEGPLALSYDYKPGVTLESYLKNNQASFKLQKNLAFQFIMIYCKLMNKCIYHEDFNYRNFIIDDNNMLHIIDFGMMDIYGRNKIGIDQRNLPKGVNFDNYPEPPEDYRDVDFYQSDNEKFDHIKSKIRYNLTHIKGLIKDVDIVKQLNNSKSLQEVINILS